MKKTYLFLLLVLLAFVACTSETSTDSPSENTDETTPPTEVSEQPEPEAPKDYSNGYADFVPPEHGELLPQEEWGNALIGSWLTYGFESGGQDGKEMNTMLDMMQVVDTYNADGSWEMVMLTPMFDDEVSKTAGYWRLEVDNFRVNEEDPIIIVEMSENHIGYNMPSDEVVEGVEMGKVMYYKYKVPQPTL